MNPHATDRDDLVVHEWRVPQLARPGIPVREHDHP
jgi:hypothetical protein